MKEEKINELKEEMAHIIVNLPDRRASLLELCEKVGVRNRIHYYNNIEVLAPNHERGIYNPTTVEKVIWDRGLEFNDGTILRHVENKYLKVFPAPHKRGERKKTMKTNRFDCDETFRELVEAVWDKIVKWIKNLRREKK